MSACTFSSCIKAAVYPFGLLLIAACLSVCVGGLVDGGGLGVVDVFAQAAAPGQGEVFGPAPTPQQPTFLGSLMELLPVIVICYFIFYFMVIKPQDSTAKAHKSLLESLKRGDEVVTSGGLIGKVTGSENQFVFLEIASGVKVKVDGTAIKKRLGDDAKAKAA